MPTGDASLDGMGINYIGGKETYSGDDGIDFGRDRGSIKPVTPRTPGLEVHNPTMPTISPIGIVSLQCEYLVTYPTVKFECEFC